MSKTTFRSRNIEPDRPIAIYHVDELNDLNDYTSVSRSITQMPTGMEKEEETEHHIKIAMEAQSQFGNIRSSVIPIPEVIKLDRAINSSHRRFTVQKNYIKQGLDFEENSQRYDVNSEDELWLLDNRSKFEKKLEKLDFEKCIDKLEFIQRYHPQDIHLNKPETILGLPLNTSSLVFKYWQSKRHKLPKLTYSLVPEIKTEQSDGVSAHDPYVAFRKRFEKMQTRKNRKQDETHFEKFIETYSILLAAEHLVKISVDREKLKKMYQNSIQKLFHTRLMNLDGNNQLLRNAFTPLYENRSLDPFKVNSMIGTGILQHNYISMSKSLWRFNNGFKPFLKNKNIIFSFIETTRNKKDCISKAKEDINTIDHYYKRKHTGEIVVHRSNNNDLVRYRTNRCGKLIQDVISDIQNVDICLTDDDPVAELRHRRQSMNFSQDTELSIMLPSYSAEKKVEDKLDINLDDQLLCDPIFDVLTSPNTPFKTSDIFTAEISEPILKNISNSLLNLSDSQNLFT